MGVLDALDGAEAPRATTGKRRTDEQGIREKGVRLRPTDAAHPPTLQGENAKNRPEFSGAITSKGEHSEIHSEHIGRYGIVS